MIKQIHKSTCPLQLFIPYGRTELIIAFENRHLDLVKILIEAGANVNQSDMCTHNVLPCSSCAILYLQNF